MYKCTDCNQEYENKPDFCDCGNDNFEFIEQIPQQQLKQESPKSPQIKKIVTQDRRKRKEVYQLPVDIPSLLIFFICIVLSILSIIFIGKDSNNVVQEQDKNTSKQTIQIPPIDKIWEESKIVVQKPVQTIKVVQKNTNNTTTKKSTPKKVTNKTNKQKAVSTTTKKTATKTDVQNTTKQQSNQQQTVKNPSPKQTVTETLAPVPSSNATKIELQPTIKKIDPEIERKELNIYKANLRDKIGKSINFIQVIGDGKCAVTFKIDSSGNLVNRNFSIQSPNNSLNDVVYSAILNNPTYKTPPSGYKGETLILNVQIYNGQFEVSLK